MGYKCFHINLGGQDCGFGEFLESFVCFFFVLYVVFFFFNIYNDCFPICVIVNGSGIGNIVFFSSCFPKKWEVMKASFVGSFVFFLQKVSLLKVFL